MEAALKRGDSPQLSEDVLALVFACLDRPEDRQAAGLTCRAWLAVVSSRVVGSLHVVLASIVPKIAVRYRSLTSLDLSRTRNLHLSSIQALAAAYGATLTSLSCANNKGLGDAALRVLGAGCPYLTLLDLSSCHHERTPLTDKGVAALAGCTALQHLRLAGCRALSDAGVASLAPCLPQLQELCLRWCTGLSDAALTMLRRHCGGTVRSLDLAYCAFQDDGLAQVASLPALHTLLLACCSQVGDVGLCHLGRSKSITKLDLSGCKEITGRGLACMVARSQALRELSVAYDKQLTPAALASYHRLPDLQALTLSGCSVNETGLQLLGAGCPQLTALTLWDCEGVTDAGVAAVAVHCRSLAQLDLTCCRALSSPSLQTLADLCPRLAVLRLEGCQGVTPPGLHALQQRCPHLREINLTDCALGDAAGQALAGCAHLEVLRLGFNPLSNAGVLALASAYAARRSPLRELDLYRCAALDDGALTALLPHCPALERLNLSYCPDLTDATLGAVSACPRLENLEMRGWVRATSAGLATMARGCARLQDLDVKHCTTLRDDALGPLVAHCPVLKQLHLSCCPFSDAALAPLATCHTLQTIKMVQCKALTGGCLYPFISGCESIRKIKLDGQLRAQIPADDVTMLEARLCYVKWIDK